NCFILPGIGIIPSAKTAIWMRENVPGVHISDHIIKRLKDADKPAHEGRLICAEMMQEMKEIEGVSGIHLMAYRQEKWVGDVVKSSKVLGPRIPWSPGNDVAKI
ncbi:MAG: methylenetetrahydrofolate reductase, partial [Litorimonas sp.]